MSHYGPYIVCQDYWSCLLIFRFLGLICRLTEWKASGTRNTLLFFKKWSSQETCIHKSWLKQENSLASVSFDELIWASQWFLNDVGNPRDNPWRSVRHNLCYPALLLLCLLLWTPLLKILESSLSVLVKRNTVHNVISTLHISSLKSLVSSTLLFFKVFTHQLLFSFFNVPHFLPHRVSINAILLSETLFLCFLETPVQMLFSQSSLNTLPQNNSSIFFVSSFSK